jgi:acetyl-CoA C-acetyltransferase
MSRVAMGSDGGGIDGDNRKLRERVFQVPQGISADLIATREGFTREDVDKWALSSQQRAAAAIQGGRFKSIVPITDPAGKVVTADEHPRADTTLAGLGQLPASFKDMGGMAVGPNGETLDQIALRGYPDVKEIRHVHSAGNSSGIVDGAAAVLLASADFVKAHGLKPRAKIRAVATLGAEPVIMLTAPAPVSKRALQKAGMQPRDIDHWEINEAFAAVVLQTTRALEIDPARVNPDGGAIALGHPLGATGAMLLGNALDALEQRNQTTALVTLCIGGGQGIATIVERI